MSDGPGTKQPDRGDSSPLSAENRDLLLANIGIVRDNALADIRAGEDPLAVVQKAAYVISGFVAGAIAMVVPPYMIDPETLSAAVKRGQELAEEHGWQNGPRTNPAEQLAHDNVYDDDRKPEDGHDPSKRFPEDLPR